MSALLRPIGAIHRPLRRTFATISDIRRQLGWSRDERIAIVRYVREWHAADARSGWRLAIDKAMQDAILRGEWELKIEVAELAKKAPVYQTRLLEFWQSQLILTLVGEELAVKDIYVALRAGVVHIDFGPDSLGRIKASQPPADTTP